MTNLTKIIESRLQQSKLSEIVTKSNERFRDKLFAEKYYTLYTSTTPVRYLLSLFSICTGVFFFLSIATKLPFWFSALSGVSLFLILELAKGKLTSIALTEVLPKYFNFISISSSILALCLFCGSVFFSVQGMQSIYKEVDTSVNDLQDSYEVKKDSVMNYYHEQIATVKQEKNGFIESVSYRGKINIHNKTTASTIEQYNSQIENLQAELKAESGNRKAENGKRKAETVQASSFNAHTWIVISVCVEVSILICLFFASYYEYRTHIESGIIDVTAKDIKTAHTPSYAPVTANSLEAENIPSVGFKFSGAVTAKETAKDNGNMIRCKHCNNECEKKAHNQKYCSEVCRISAWKQRTGKELIKA